MNFSFTLFGISPELYAPLVCRADERGFEAVWWADHVVAPIDIKSSYPYAQSGKAPPAYSPRRPISDPWLTICYVAALTKRIKLGTSVYVLTLRHPLLTALSVATAQNLSKGRVLLGVGTGWVREEYEALGIEWEGRGARMDECLDVLDKVWSGQPAEHRGKSFNFLPLQFSNVPVPRVPLLVGGASRPALLRAAQRGDGWIAAPGSLEDAIGYRAQLREIREAAGRGHLPFDYYVTLDGDIEAGNLRRYEDAGFDHIVVWPFTVPCRTVQERLDVLDRAADVLAAAGYPMG